MSIKTPASINAPDLSELGSYLRHIDACIGVEPGIGKAGVLTKKILPPPWAIGALRTAVSVTKIPAAKI